MRIRLQNNHFLKYFVVCQVLTECSLRSYWMYELTEIYNGEVMLHSMLAHNEAICAAVERSRDYVMITNKNHIIRVRPVSAVIIY